MCSNVQTMEWTLLVLWIYIVADGMATTVMHHYKNDDRFAGVVPTVNTQWSCRSLVECAVRCMVDSDCESYVFDGSTCYGFATRMITTTPTTVNALASYFENKGVLGRNLAARKPSSQNGLYGGHGTQGNYTANMANDDSRQAEPNGLIGSCSHLGYTSVPQTMWWQVDLEDVYRVTNVALLPRKDGFPGEFENIKVSVGMTSAGDFTDCVADTGPGFYGEMRSYVCPVPIVGQFVKVSKYTSGWTFTLCEAEVYGEI